MTIEVRPSGLLIDTVADLVATISAEMKANVDPNMDVSADSPDGEEIGIFASHDREVQEVVQVLADAFDPDNAEGARLDVIGALRGVIRNPATFTTFDATRKIRVTMGPGKTLPGDGTALCSVLNFPDRVFAILEPADNSAGVIDTNFFVKAVCLQSGPVHANAGVLTVIKTPVAGWLSVLNTTDPELGQDTETDVAYRQRQEDEIRQFGTSTNAAMLAALLGMTDAAGNHPIRSAVVLENTSDAVANGLPPHSFECVIWDGLTNDAVDADVAQTIYNHTPLGVQTVGTGGAFVTDPYGNLVAVHFTRASVRLVTITIGLRDNPLTYVGNPAVQQAVADAFQARIVKPGAVVSFSQMMAVVQALPGIVDGGRIDSWSWSLLPLGPVSFSDLTLGPREIAAINDATTDVAVVAFPV